MIAKNTISTRNKTISFHGKKKTRDSFTVLGYRISIRISIYFDSIKQHHNFYKIVEMRIVSFIKRNLFDLILSDESSTRHRSNKKHGNKNRLLVLV